MKPFLFSLLVALGCKSTPPEPAAAPTTDPAAAENGLPDRDPALARKLVRDEGALLIDVRTQEEFDGGHVEGAILIPHDQIGDRIDEVLEAQGGDKSKPIVVYCRSGRRAGEAKKTLTGAGFQNVSNLGGVGDWCEDC